VTVGREGSFTRAAAVLGVTQSALSQAIRGLEERLQIRLLTRTTRSVSPTPAGERLMQAIGHRFDEIEAELDALTDLRDKPAGTVRITAAEHSAVTILWPALATLLPRYPDIKVEVNIDYGFTDIVTERFDAGVRLGEQVAKDMVAVRVGPDFCMAVVGTPSYFAVHPKPAKPQDLTAHRCLTYANFGRARGRSVAAVKRSRSPSAAISARTRRRPWYAPHWRVAGWPFSPRTWRTRTLPTAVCSGCCRTGHSPTWRSTPSTHHAATCRPRCVPCSISWSIGSPRCLGRSAPFRWRNSADDSEAVSTQILIGNERRSSLIRSPSPLQRCPWLPCSCAG